MRRATLALALIGALGAASFAQGGYKAQRYAGAIGPKGERHALTFTYERLSKGQRLVNDARFRGLAVECTPPGSKDSVEGELAAFNQPSPAWVLNRRKKIRGPKDFRRVWRGKNVPIESPDGSKTKFRAKRAELHGRFKKGLRKARGGFSIRWKEVDEKSGEVLYACATSTRWHVKRVKREGR